MIEYSPALAEYIQAEKDWMIYRAENLLFYPSDPRWKGFEHRDAHNKAREHHNELLKSIWPRLEEWELEFLDPQWTGGLGWLRETYEKKVLMLREGSMMEYGWPDPLCKIVGNLCPKDLLHSPRFICMNCWKMYDLDPASDSVIVGGPDEAWIVQHLAEARSKSDQAPRPGVPG